MGTLKYPPEAQQGVLWFDLCWPEADVFGVVNGGAWQSTHLLATDETRVPDVGSFWFINWFGLTLLDAQSGFTLTGGTSEFDTLPSTFDIAVSSKVTEA